MTPEEVTARAKERETLLRRALGFLSEFEKEARDARNPGLTPRQRESAAEQAKEYRGSYNNLAREARRAVAEVGLDSKTTLLLGSTPTEVDLIDEATFIEKWGMQVLDSAGGLLETAIGEWQRIAADPSKYTVPAPPDVVEIVPTRVDPATLTIGQLLRMLTVPQTYATIVALVLAGAAIFGVGYAFGKRDAAAPSATPGVSK